MERIISKFYCNICNSYEKALENIGDSPTPSDLNTFKIKVKKDTDIELNIIVKSIIKGDFIGFNDNLAQKIGNICEKSRTKCKSIIIINPEISQYFEQNTDTVFLGVRDILAEFFTLIYQFNITTNHFIYQRQTFISITNGTLSELCEYCNLFLLDYSITDNISYYEKLSELEKRKNKSHLENPFNNLKIFEAKIKFLKYKWLKRQKYNSQKLKELVNKNYTRKYLFNNDIVDLDNKIKIGEPYYLIYKDWIDKIDYHYFDEERNDYDFVDKTLDKENNLDSYDLYLKVKYYKDKEISIKKLNKLESNFDSIGSLSKNSKKKNLLYYYNNLFSALIKNGNLSEDQIDKKFHEIVNHYKITKNNNFFLYYKYLEYKIVQAQKYINNDNYERVDIAHFHELLSVCKNHFEWCKNGFNRLYDFDKNNCVIIIDEQEVYHASSFSLPLSISENEQLINNLERNLNQLENLLLQAKSTNFLSGFQDELRKTEKKSIETISLFTAVISFIVGTVASYQFIQSVAQSLMFFIAFGLTISIFVVLIFITTRGTKIVKDGENLKYFFITYLTVFLVFIFLYKYYREVEIPGNRDKTQKQIDNLKAKNDSLIKSVDDMHIELNRLKKRKAL